MSCFFGKDLPHSPKQKWCSSPHCRNQELNYYVHPSALPIWDGTEIFISLDSHATTDNLTRCPEFTVAFATADTLVAADYVGIESGRQHPDKIARTGWNSEKGQQVNAPVYDCFPMTLECRVKEKLYESSTGCYLIGEIVNILCREDMLAEDGKPDVEKMQLITFDPCHNGYITLGKRAGDAFSAGKELK